MAIATLRSKGRITLPKEVRTALGFKAGDRVEFVLMEDGNYALLPAMHSVRTLEGFFYKSGRKSTSLEEMDDAVAKRAGGE